MRNFSANNADVFSGYFGFDLVLQALLGTGTGTYQLMVFGTSSITVFCCRHGSSVADPDPGSGIRDPGLGAF
jgi:hypothetical protein